MEASTFYYTRLPSLYPSKTRQHGIQPPQTSWGLLISYGAETMEEYPWLLIFPGMALTITLFSLNFLGDGLRDALDVRGSKD